MESLCLCIICRTLLIAHESLLCCNHKETEKDDFFSTYGAVIYVLMMVVPVTSQKIGGSRYLGKVWRGTRLSTGNCKNRERLKLVHYVCGMLHYVKLSPSRSCMLTYFFVGYKNEHTSNTV